MSAESTNRRVRPEPKMYDDDVAILPVGRGENINPAHPAGDHWCRQEDDGLLVVRVAEGKYRAINTCGNADFAWHPIGQVMVCHHDQTGRWLAEAEVVGHVWSNGETEGHVPDRMIPLWVFK